jgi:hypothetical protein
MMLGNMRELGVRHVIAYCHNEACRHSALIDVSSYPGDIEVPWFKRANRGKCGGKRVDVRPNWKEAPGSVDDRQRPPGMNSAHPAIERAMLIALSKRARG